jgi:hypothetical protein
MPTEWNTATATETISRAEYDRLRRHDYAGPASSLLPSTREGWTGTHWVMRASARGGVELAPVNLVER